MSFPAAILAAAPTSYYAFSGDDPFNVTGLGPRPSAVAGVTFSRSQYPAAAGVVPGSVGFDPARMSRLDFGSRGLDAFITSKAAATVLMTVYVNSYSAGPGTTSLLTKAVSGATLGFSVEITTTGTLRVGGRSRAADSFQQGNSVDLVGTGAWKLIVGELNFTAKTIKGWVDGTQIIDVNSVTGFGQNTYTQSSTTVNDLAGSYSSADKTLNGSIAHLALFDKALNDTQRGDIFSAWLDRPSVSGIVYDDTGTPAARTVRLIDRATGQFLGETVSDAGTGAYSIGTPSVSEAQVVFLDDAGGTTYNDKIIRVVPA